MKQTVKELQKLSVGCVTKVGDYYITAKELKQPHKTMTRRGEAVYGGPGTTPCNNCYFERERMKHDVCPYIQACITLHREDGKSVKFIKVR